MSIGQDRRGQRTEQQGNRLPVPAEEDSGGKTRKRGKGGVRPAGDALPTRTRSYGSMAVGVALVAGCGLAGALYLSQAGDTDTVLAVTGSVAKGQTLERGDLHSVEVTGVDNTFSVDQLSSVIGMTASVDLVDGQILTAPQLSEDPVPGKGQAMVGISLEAPQIPGEGLEPGDLVRVVGVPDPESSGSSADDPTVLSDQAEVYGVRSNPAQTDRSTVTIILPDGDADKVSAYAAASRVSLVEISASDGSDQ